jgi:hypothetical protein
MIKKTAYKLYMLISALIIICGGTALAWSMHYGISKLPLRQYLPHATTNAIWDWSNPLAKTQKDLDELSDFMYLHQLNAVYIDVGQYETITTDQTTDPSIVTERKQKLETALDRYITTLKKRNIAVYAAAGDVSWSNPDKRHIPLGILQAVESYNGSHPNARFAGMEFDIESYNQPGFATGSTTVQSLTLTDYLTMVDKLAAETETFNRQTSSNFELGFAIPYWFDNENGNIPAVTWNDKTGPTLFHLMDRLNRLPKSNVVVMAYRNVARGTDGIISHARTEVDYAQSKASNVKVIIGQEVNDTEPAKITYYGESVTELSSQVKVLSEVFSETGSFDGVAINDLAGLRALEEQ